MAKRTATTEKRNDADGFYKGYDIEWLRANKEEHPDGHLVDEYDNLNKIRRKNNGKS